MNLPDELIKDLKASILRGVASLDQFVAASADLIERHPLLMDELIPFWRRVNALAREYNVLADRVRDGDFPPAFMFRALKTEGDQIMDYLRTL